MTTSWNPCENECDREKRKEEKVDRRRRGGKGYRSGSTELKNLSFIISIIISIIISFKPEE
jgi:hypothetical protein